VAALTTARRVIVLSTLGVLLAACSSLPVSQTYLSQKTYGLYLAIPSSYTALPAQDSSATQPDQPASFLQAFYGPGGNPDQLLSGSGVGGYIGMRVVDGDLEEAEVAAANSVVTDLAQAVNDGQVSILNGPVVTEETDSFVTIEWTLRLQTGSEPGIVVNRSTIGTFSANPPGQPEAHVVKTLVLGCSQSCFDANAEQVDRIISSWRFN